MMTDDTSEPGAAPRVSFAPWPHFEADEVAAAQRVLLSGKVNYWTGSEGREFEREFAEYVGTRFAVATANGTVALELALRAIGIGPGDEVITSSRTFIASASCAVAVGARPVIADVDRESQNLTAETIRPRITPHTKAIIAVHLAGWPCEMPSIMQLAQEHGIQVVEDCAQAQGARYFGKAVGSLGHIAAFSFCQDKIMTTAGEGGMLTTNDAELPRRAWSYKDHGKNRALAEAPKSDHRFRWVHESFGTNWRLTEFQSAIGRVVLPKVPRWLERRRSFATILNSRFAQLPLLRTTVPPPHIAHAYYKYYVFLRPERLKKSWSRDRIIEEMNARGVPCFTGSCSEIYRERAFDIFPPQSSLPTAKELGETSLMLLVHPTLTEEMILYAAGCLESISREATEPLGATASVHEDSPVGKTAEI